MAKGNVYFMRLLRRFLGVLNNRYRHRLTTSAGTLARLGSVAGGNLVDLGLGVGNRGR